MLATDYVPPAGFDAWFANLAYLSLIAASILHMVRGKNARSIKIEGDIATTGYVDDKCDELLRAETFNDYKETAERDREELRGLIKEVKVTVKETEDKIDKFSGDNYRSRRGMHKKINAHSNALYFMAGQSPNSGAIKRILERGETEDGSDEG